MDSSFDDREKRFILAEMIKASRVNLEAMINFVKGCNISPDWLEMQIPHGRTVNQCKQVAASMGIETPQHIPSQRQPHSYQQTGQQYPAQEPQYHQQHAEHQPSQHPGQHQRQLHHETQQSAHPQQQQQLPLPLPFPTTKRKPSIDASEHVPKRPAVTSPEIHASSHPRNIQPRPPANGLVSANPRPAVTAPASHRVPKKRGRPSRADKVAQARAAGVTGHTFPFLAPATRPIAAAEPGSSISLSPPTGSPRLHTLSPKIDDDTKRRPSLESSPQLGQPPKPATIKPKTSTTHPSSDEAQLAQHDTRSPKSPASASLPPSSRVAVSDLIKTTTPAVVTTGV